jgi:hypothetical protein
VLLAGAGALVFWRTTEPQRQQAPPPAVLLRLDQLAARLRRNADSLLLLSGAKPPRARGAPEMRLVDLVRAAIAQTEEADRVAVAVDERPVVLGRAVADLAHLLAELVENAVRCSPPRADATVRSRPSPRAAGAWLLTVEDRGAGMGPEDLARANRLLADPGEGRPVGVAAARPARGRAPGAAPPRPGGAGADPGPRRHRRGGAAARAVRRGGAGANGRAPAVSAAGAPLVGGAA